LDDIIDQPARLRSQRAAESADHSGGYGALKAVGITDGYHQLSHPDQFRISQGSRHEMIAIDANHRQIRVRIFPDQARFEAPSIGKRHAELAGPMHHVAVGQNKAIRREHKARAAAA
jgi:hypothetical protein